MIVDTDETSNRCPFEKYFFWINCNFDSSHIAEYFRKRFPFLIEFNISRKPFNVSNYWGFWNLHTLIVDSWITFLRHFILCRPFTGDLKLPCNQQLRKFSWNKQKKLNKTKNLRAKEILTVHSFRFVKRT